VWELWVVVIVTAVGLADAIIGGQADLAVLFGAAMASALVALVRQARRTDRIGIRRDVAVWLRRRADAEGTTPDDVATRLLAAARAGLDGSNPDDAGQRTR